MTVVLDRLDLEYLHQLELVWPTMIADAPYGGGSCEGQEEVAASIAFAEAVRIVYGLDVDLQPIDPLQQNKVTQAEGFREPTDGQVI